MKEEIINGIKYRLDEDKMIAEVIQLKDDFELDEAKLTAEKLWKMVFNHYEGDIIIPEVVVFDELTYRVERIGDKAFAHSSLKSVTISDSVTSIGEGAFEGCDSLTSKVELGEEIIGGIKYCLYCNRTAKIVEVSGDNTGAIIIPETIVFNTLTYRVTSIGTCAFRYCDKLESVTIPNSVTSIGEQAFECCFSLTKITIPNSVTIIGKKAFNDCHKLESITIPNGVTSIGELAFSCCYELTEIVIPNSVTSIGYRAFEICTSLKSILIPINVTEIEKNAFVGCKGLTSIIVAEGNPMYDSRENCNAIIETATNTLIQGCSQTIIPESVTEIGEEAFAICDSLTSIVISDNVTSIGAEAFRNCESLKSVTIPASIKSIGSMAFDWCKNLADITFQGTIAQWKEIKLSRSWKSNVPSTVVHCADGDVSAWRY